MASSLERKPHAALDIDSRLLKAKKIENILGIPPSEKTLHLLEIGTGSGGIANYFANYSQSRFKVYAVDVIDNRVVDRGYEFKLVNGVELPFDRDFFDIVISNHVIEHVGSYSDQCVHLNEIFRVLKNTGIGYLAVPNRWMLVEPHYKLIFLSWLPKSIRTPYLRMMGRGNFYDCEPLEKHQIEKMLFNCGFAYKNRCFDALKLLVSLEDERGIFIKYLSKAPHSLLKPFLSLMPTLLYTFRKK